MTRFLAGWLGVTLALAGTAQAAEPLRVCTAAWPPHTLVSAGVPVGGDHTERVVRALQAAGYALTIDAISWQRCLHDLAEGYYAAAYPASYSAERARFAVYPELPIDTVRNVVVVRRGEGGGWDGRRDLAALPQPLAVPRGFLVTEAVRVQAGAHVRVDDGAEYDEQDLRKLLAGRVGAVVIEAGVARYLLARVDPGHRLQILDEPIERERKYFLIFGSRALGERGAENVAARFSSALAAERR